LDLSVRLREQESSQWFGVFLKKLKF
jgi:hypothetical protein